MNNILSSIERLVALGKSPGNSTPQLARLLQMCVTETGANSGKLYSLELAPLCFKLIAAINTELNPQTISCEILTGSLKEPRNILDEIISSNRLMSISDLADERIAYDAFGAPVGTGSRLLIPMSRGSRCLGFIDLVSDHPHCFDSNHLKFCEIAVHVALVLIEKSDVLGLFKALPEPVNFKHGTNEFYAEIMVIAAAASRMPYIVLRELDEERLSLLTLASWGFDGAKPDQLNLAPLSNFPSFKTAIETGRPVIENSMDAPHLRPLRDHECLEHVRSFLVVPVNVGGEVLGTLSFGSDCEYDYTAIEEWSLETIANFIGVSILNFRHFCMAQEAHYQEGRTMAAIQTVEAAQSARHEVKQALDSAITNTATILLLCEKGEPNLSEIVAYGRSIDQSLRDARIAIDKIRLAANPPKRETRVVDIRKIWEEAKDMLHGKLVSSRVNVSIVGSATVRCAPDFLRSAFSHFLINSVDAFEQRAKRNRTIQITISTSPDSASNVHIRYVDNAGGIDPSKLKPSIPKDTRVNQYIFEKDVTSKPEGSGFGMYLVRQILRDNKGSVNLVDYRNGIVFDITLPKHIQ